MLDLRYPMGMMFALVGAILAVYGVITNSSGMEEKGIYQVHSLGLNINLIWGLVLLGFGLLMLAMAYFSAPKEKDTP
jgi:tellurite resistance protein TehA-like permease